MRKLAIIAVSTLLIASHSFAAPAQDLDARNLANTILNMHKAKVSDKGSFAIVYGGQDISRTNPGSLENFGSPVFVG